MPIFLLFTILFCFPTLGHAAHQVFGEQWLQDKRLLPEEDYVHQGADAETFDEIGYYFPEFARRVLAQFVLRAEQLGFAKELDQPPTPDQQGVTEIELPSGNIRYYDTSRIYRAMNATLTDEDGQPVLDENGSPVHFHPHVDDRTAAFQALLSSDKAKRDKSIPHWSNPAWYEHFGPPE